MSNRARLFIILSIVVLLVLGGSLYFLARSRQKPGATQTQTNTTDGQNTQNTGENFVPVTQNPVSKPPTVKATSLATEQAGVVQLAKVFIERYNSYSTDSKYDNIIEVKSLVTANLWQSLSRRLSVTPVSNGFVGVTTAAMSANLLDWKGDSATVTIGVVKETTKDNTVGTAQQSVTVSMVKQDNNWLVDSFTWQK